MSRTVLWVLVSVGLAVVIVRRRSVAVALVTGQALLLSAVALAEAATGADVAAALALLLRATALGALFLFLVSRTREARPVRAGVAPFARAGLAVALALALPWLVPEIGLESRDSERAVLALVFGLVCAATRRATLFQVLGIVLVENGSRSRRSSCRAGRPRSRSSSASPSTTAHRARRRRLPRADLRRVRRRRPPRRSEDCVTSREALAVAVVAAPALGACSVALAPRRAVTAVATGAALVTCALAIALSAVAFTEPGNPFVGDWIVADAAAGLLIGVIGLVGLASVLVSPAYLATLRSALVGPKRRTRAYYLLLLAFWAILLAVPLAGNLAGAWLLVEATTAASAVLVGFSGRHGRSRRAGNA